ncbi:MAG: ribonuclease III [Woeseiaceae bacterium]|nr:ribonuclease III [Woeseiaceae bacterium]
MTKQAETWLLKSLDYEFEDPDLLAQALTHRSAAGTSNERLEFLGDAVLDVVVSEFLFRSHAHAPEGDLSRMRAALVNDSALGDLAQALGVGEHLALGGGERKAGGHRRESILADALEALFGAVYLDRGFEAARGFIERAFGDRLLAVPAAAELRDPKTRLQEWLQGKGLPLPEYELVDVTGAAHRQRFEVACRVASGAGPTTGTGTSRRGAEQDAAEKMLAALGAEPLE